MRTTVVFNFQKNVELIEVLVVYVFTNLFYFFFYSNWQLSTAWFYITLCGHVCHILGCEVALHSNNLLLILLNFLNVNITVLHDTVKHIKHFFLCRRFLPLYYWSYSEWNEINSFYFLWNKNWIDYLIRSYDLVVRVLMYSLLCIYLLEFTYHRIC